MRTVCFHFLLPLYFGHILSLCIFLNVFIFIGYLYFCHNWMQHFYCTPVFYIPIGLQDVACIVGNPTVVRRPLKRETVFTRVGLGLEPVEPDCH